MVAVSCILLASVIVLFPALVVAVIVSKFPTLEKIVCHEAGCSALVKRKNGASKWVWYPTSEIAEK